MLKKGGKAQAAVEYLMIAALITIMIVPATFLFYNYALKSSADIGTAQADKLGRDIVNNAEMVHYFGYPSGITLEEAIPENIAGIEVEESSGVYVLKISVKAPGGITEFAYPTRVNIVSSISQAELGAGTKKITLAASPLSTGSPPVTLSIGEGENCAGGAVHNTCSAPQPKFCFNKALLDNCQQCGCPGSVECKTDGTCLTP